jgi:hypothetical protein
MLPFSRCASWAGVALAVLSAPAWANTEPAQWRLVLHVRSWHASAPPQITWNEFNPGLGLRRQLSTDWAWQVGAYRNSIGGTSAYGLWDWTPWHAERWALGLSAGAVVGGYQERVKPAVGLYGQWQHERWGAALRVFPKPPPGRYPELHRSAATALELSWRLP